MRRGEVWWADLGEPKGSAPALLRPVIIVQDDLLTESKLATVMIVPLTSNLKRAAAAGNVEIEPKDASLKSPSVALVCQVMTIDKTLLTRLAGLLPKRVMHRIDLGLRLALGLSI